MEFKKISFSKHKLEVIVGNSKSHLQVYLVKPLCPKFFPSKMINKKISMELFMVVFLNIKFFIRSTKLLEINSIILLNVVAHCTMKSSYRNVSVEYSLPINYINRN